MFSMTVFLNVFVKISRQLGTYAIIALTFIKITMHTASVVKAIIYTLIRIATLEHVMLRAAKMKEYARYTMKICHARV